GGAHPGAGGGTSQLRHGPMGWLVRHRARRAVREAVTEQHVHHVAGVEREQAAAASLRADARRSRGRDGRLGGEGAARRGAWGRRRPASGEPGATAGARRGGSDGRGQGGRWGRGGRGGGEEEGRDEGRGGGRRGEGGGMGDEG